jgi:hypothetical protein
VPGLVAALAALLRLRARACVALACIATALCMASVASAQPSAQTKTRVWAFESAPALNTWLHAAATQRTHPANRSGGAEHASASPHAARGAGVVAKDIASAPQSATALAKQLASEAQLGEMVAGTGERIAGAGARAAFRDAGRIAQTYGGNAADWVKMSSSGFRAADGTTFATHWVENIVTGQQVEAKVVIDVFGRP